MPLIVGGVMGFADLIGSSSRNLSWPINLMNLFMRRARKYCKKNRLNMVHVLPVLFMQ
jgi:hypothetical protein